MNVLALIGSQRKHGNTSRIVQMIEARMHALATLHGTPVEFETLYLGDYDIRPCRGCRACFDLGEERCPLPDDVSGLIKNWMDRLAYLSHRPAMGGKCAFTIATVGGSGTRRTLRTMDAALLTWGYHLVGRAGMKMGALAPGEELPLFQPPAEKAADRIFSAVAGHRALDPAFVSLMVFRIQQLVWPGEPAGSYDRAYWGASGFHVGHSAPTPAGSMDNPALWNRISVLNRARFR